MSTTGGFAVDQSGAATYSIPIRVPAGVAGFEPRLAISYNSRAGNGSLGMGWSLSGLSMITRCAGTLAQDNVNWPNGTNVDRFCLDGQRLISSKYFDETAVYKKAITDLSSVISSGPTLSLTNTSGQTLQYGATDDSYLEVNAMPTGRSQVLENYRVLAVNRVTAAQGYPMQMDIRYNKDATNGELYPKSIVYLGTVATTVEAQQNSVQFFYESRPDVEVRYTSGIKLRTSVRLKEIRTYRADTLANVYQLSYNQDPGTGRSRLTSVVECAGDGTCLPPTVISYPPSEGVSFGGTVQSAVLDWGQATGRAWVDVNGDGLPDFCRVVGTAGAYRAACTLATSDGFGETITSAVIDPGQTAGRAWVDANGDGRPDYCRLTGTTNNQDSRAECLLSTGTGFSGKVTSGVLDWGPDTKRAWWDADGDGRVDFCNGFSPTTYSVRCAYSSGSVLSALVTLGDPKPIGPPSAEVGSDMQNFFCRASNSIDPALVSKTCMFFGNNYNNGSSVFLLGWGETTGRGYADINGDGYADYCRVIGTSGSNKLACTPSLSAATRLVSNDAPAVDVVSDILNAGSSTGRFWVDINMDGRADYCRRTGSTNLVDSRIACTLSKDGAGFGATITSDVLDWGQDTGGEWVDFRGEGHPSYCRLTGTVNGQDSRLSCTQLQVEAGRVASITSGLNNQISIAYKSLTNPSVYTKDTNAVYPLRDVVSAGYVVSTVTKQNGAGSVQTTNYKYGGYKADIIGGRGGLGFRWVQSTRAETSLSSVTEYGQVWPYIGLPMSVKTLLPGSGRNGVLAQQINTYSCEVPPGGFNCTPEDLATNPSFRFTAGLDPYLSSSVESRWDLNGAAFPVVTTNIVVDPVTMKTKNKTVSTNDGFTTSINNIFDSSMNGLVIKTKTTETRTKQ